MTGTASQILTQAGITAPLFVLVLLGYVLTRFGQWPTAAADALTRFVFAVAIPAYLFTLMSGFSSMPRVDARLLIAYFGGALTVFVAARILSARVFGMDGAQQSVFGMGTIFSNSVLLGIPLAQATLGEEVLPAVSLVLVFNSFALWTLVTVSVEWARNRDVSFGGVARTAREVVTNPVVAGILLGTIFGYTGLPMPLVVGRTLELVSQAALPMSLIVLGMGLADYGVSDGWRISLSVTTLKLAAMPVAVWLIADLLALPPTETRAVVMLASLPVGANVYLMARQFRALEGPVASSLVLSTVVAALTTPLVLTLVR